MNSMRIRCRIAAVVPMAIAMAACFSPQQQTVPTGRLQPILNHDDSCRILCGMVIRFTGQDLLPNPISINGKAVARNISFSDANGRAASTTERITSLVASGNDPQFGTVTTTLDTSRVTTPSTITANQEKKDFPATGRINFHATISLGSRPGVVYRNREEIQIEDRNLKTLRPHVNADYHLLKPVTFVDTRRPDEAAFTMNELNVAIN